MGQKVHPKSLRLGINKYWDSVWFFPKKREYQEAVIEDHNLRKFIFKEVRRSILQRMGIKAKEGSAKFKDPNPASIEKIIIKRKGSSINITIYTAKPAVVIGKKGAEIENLRSKIQREFGKQDVTIEVKEVEHPDLSAKLVAHSIARQLEQRVSFRRAMRAAAIRVMRVGAQGVRIEVSGRLDGAELARTERVILGKVPLHTLTADIDYALDEAMTKWGVIGVKVWIYKGLTFKDEETKKQFEILEKLKLANMPKDLV
ncbi:MAG: 30S ribosomal protein S3 [Candidatus Calescibacterium sp.]|nr:30S ribosomal protein S3 [Candidatus Calescibacterium sp.]MCX7972706.1 30S ribosomal protein S3 [bacterium]MDW8195510.1 30S ribosomal protein S3 [Candidatus Calescibacterium sp.]